ncbi:MAG: hypothetical protein AAF485_22990 [Chloroflexota bacterium]
MKSPLSEAVFRQISQDFSPEDQEEVKKSLAYYDDVAIKRVRLAILGLAKGDKKRLHRLVQSADEDFRNVLVAYDHERYGKKD